jgi:hypothetical protein
MAVPEKLAFRPPRHNAPTPQNGFNTPNPIPLASAIMLFLPFLFWIRNNPKTICETLLIWRSLFSDSRE